MICVSIARAKDVEKAIARGAGLIELRLDLLMEDPEKLWAAIPEGIRTIATCRPGSIVRAERSRMLKTCIDLGATYIDIELEEPAGFRDELAGLAREKGTAVIVSHHDFTGTPPQDELSGILQSCYTAGADVAKLATQVDARDEAASLLALYMTHGRKVILGMGSLGRITRLAAPYLGAEFTFASLDQERETAPGQFDLDQLKDVFKIIDRL